MKQLDNYISKFYTKEFFFSNCFHIYIWAFLSQKMSYDFSTRISYTIAIIIKYSIYQSIYYLVLQMLQEIEALWFYLSFIIPSHFGSIKRTPSTLLICFEIRGKLGWSITAYNVINISLLLIMLCTVYELLTDSQNTIVIPDKIATHFCARICGFSRR